MAGRADNDYAFIIGCVEQYWPDVAITQALLDPPTSDFVINFYQHFQEAMIAILRRITNTETADVPKASGDPIFSTLRCANKYLKMSPLNRGDVNVSLTLTDLYEPTTKKTKVTFKVLLNVMLYYEQKANSVGDAVTKRLENVQMYEKKKEEKKVLEEKLAKEAENVARTEDLVHKLQIEEEKANARYKNLQRQKNEKDMEHTKLRRELEELVGTHQNKRTLLESLKSNIQCLSEQVVTDESYKTLVDLKDNLVSKDLVLETEIEFLGKNLENRRPEMIRFGHINNDLNVLNNVCEELNELQDSVSSVNTQQQILEKSYNQKTEELKIRNESVLKYKESTQALKETLQSTTVKHNILTEKMAQLEQLKAEINEERQLLREDTHNKEMLQKKVEKIQDETEQIRLKIEELNLFFENTYKNMLNSVNVSTNNFSNVLENIGKKLSDDGDSA